MDWKIFLDDVSKTLWENDDLLEKLSDSSSSWLGFAEITDDEIQKHAIRLGMDFPPSYIKFLKTSNGFKQLSCFVWDIWPLEKVNWLKNVDPNLIYTYNVLFEGEFNATDEEYFVYGSEQDVPFFRSAYLEKCLVVSGWGDASILLLNPEVKFGEEWEAWMYAPWNLGPNRYQSFEKLMIEEYNRYLQLRSDK